MGTEFQTQKREKKSTNYKISQNTTYLTFCSASCQENVSLHIFEFKLLLEIKIAASPYTDPLLSYDGISQEIEEVVYISLLSLTAEEFW